MTILLSGLETVQSQHLVERYVWHSGILDETDDARGPYRTSLAQLPAQDQYGGTIKIAPKGGAPDRKARRNLTGRKTLG